MKANEALWPLQDESIQHNQDCSNYYGKWSKIKITYTKLRNAKITNEQQAKVGVTSRIAAFVWPIGLRKNKLFCDKL